MVMLTSIFFRDGGRSYQAQIDAELVEFKREWRHGFMHGQMCYKIPLAIASESWEWISR